MSSSEAYLQNDKLKKVGVKHNYTEEEISEYVKCKSDIQYFFSTYVKIVHVDRGLVAFEPYDYQRDLLDTLTNNRHVIVKAPRQSGKSVTTVCFILHYILFNQTKSVAILANKAKTANQLLARIKLSYESLPKFIQQGITEWNKTSIGLENGCSVQAAGTSSSAIRGDSINLLMLDEFAHVQSGIAEEFFTSVLPTISSGVTTKIIITSTPLGLNYFYKLWTDAEENDSGFVPFSVKWDDIPGRDEAWKEAMIKKIGYDRWLQEFEAEFIGSSNTLIDSKKLKTLAAVRPIQSINNTDFYELPQKGFKYTIIVDVSRGTGNDNSAFIVFDITQFPYKIAAKYHSNLISPILFPDIIYNTAKKYNNASILVEINDIGQQISDTIHNDLQYENLIFIASKGASGQSVSSGFSKNPRSGIRTTTSIKKIGCANLKSLIEEDKLIIQDKHIIDELLNFIAQRNSYSADVGYTDDLVMCLVLFAWLANQKLFKETTDINLRTAMYEENINNMVAELAPIIGFGFSDGSETILLPDDQKEYRSFW